MFLKNASYGGMNELSCIIVSALGAALTIDGPAKVAAALIQAPRALTDDDFDLDVGQKGVDMRIGMDMARLALRQTVRAVIVVTGDSDFVPAFKYVRREGVKVILDPMGAGGRRELREHADIVLRPARRPAKKAPTAKPATAAKPKSAA